MSNKQKLIILIVIGIILSVLFFLNNKKEEDDLALTSSNVIVPTNVEINKIEFLNEEDALLSNSVLNTLNSLEKISLNTDIFDTLSFKTLIDGTVPLEQDKDIGRNNPFAPIGLENIINKIEEEEQVN